MANKLKGVTWDKYLGTDIDEMTVFFDQPTEDTEVGEFVVPENEKHMVFFAKGERTGKLFWIAVVNPKEVSRHSKATLPDIPVMVKDKTYSFREVVDILVAAS